MDVAGPDPTGADLRLATQADVPVLASVLARAFEDDPASRWIYPDDGQRLERLERSWALLLSRVWIPHGECLTTRTLDGAAGWLNPGEWQRPLGEKVRMAPAALRAQGRFTFRALALVALMERRHPREPEHEYLSVLGVMPERQGRGFGSHLLAPVLARCDREGVPAYLEASSERNVALYERHGFRVRHRISLPRGGPPLWLMWRDPGSQPADR